MTVASTISVSDEPRLLACATLSLPSGISGVISPITPFQINLTLTARAPFPIAQIDCLIEHQDEFFVTVFSGQMPLLSFAGEGCGCFTIPADLAAENGHVLSFHFAAPVDGMPLKHITIAEFPRPSPQLGVDYEAMPEQATLTDADVAATFINLGQNCEIGIVQRALNREPPDLYRFSAVPLAWVIFAIDNDFQDIDSNADHQLTLEHRADGQIYYYAFQTRYRIQFETGIRHDLKPQEEMLEESLRRMQYMSWRLMGDFREGSRIPSFSSSRTLTQPEIDAFSHRMTRFGHLCGFVIQPADKVAHNETLRWLAPNILCGTLPDLAHAACVVDSTNHTAWQALLRAAHDEVRLFQEALSKAPKDFDATRYKQLNPDVAHWVGNTIRHYVDFGAAEGRSYR